MQILDAPGSPSGLVVFAWVVVEVQPLLARTGQIILKKIDPLLHQNHWIPMRCVVSAVTICGKMKISLIVDTVVDA